MGRADRLRGVADDLRALGADVADASSHFITCCRLVVFLVRLGSAAKHVLGGPHDAMFPLQRFVHWMSDEDA